MLKNNVNKIFIFFVVFLLVSCSVNQEVENSVDRKKIVDNYLNLSRGYMQAGFLGKALKSIERAQKIDPERAQVYGMFALIYSVQKEDQLAEQFFKKALSIKGNSTDINNNYGAFLLKKDRLQEAYHQFHIASKDVNYFQRSRVFQNLGILSLKMNDENLAEKHFKKAIDLNYHLPGLQLELANLYYKNNKFSQAWEVFKSFESRSVLDKKSLDLGIKLSRAMNDIESERKYVEQLNLINK